MKNIVRMQIVEGIEQLHAKFFQSIVEYRVGLVLIDQELQSVSFQIFHANLHTQTFIRLFKSATNQKSIESILLEL